jgi:hypothetical protein
MKRVFAFLLVASLAIPACSQTPFGTFPVQRADSIKADSIRRSADTVGRGSLGKIKIVKRKVDYSKFVALAIGTMAFIALIITTAQAWNPTGRNP